MNKFKQMCESMLNFFGKKFDWFEETNIPISEEKPRKPRKKMISKMKKIYKKKSK